MADYEAFCQLILSANAAAGGSGAGAGAGKPGDKSGDAAATEPDPKRSRVHESTRESLALLEATLAGDDAMEVDDKAIMEAKQMGECARLAILEAEQAAAAATASATAAAEKLALATEQGFKSARSYKQIKENHKRGNGPYGGKGGGKGGLPAGSGDDSSLG